MSSGKNFINVRSEEAVHTSTSLDMGKDVNRRLFCETCEDKDVRQQGCGTGCAFRQDLTTSHSLKRFLRAASEMCI